MAGPFLTSSAAISSFSSQEVISTGSAMNPNIASYNNYVYDTWPQKVSGHGTQIMFSRSTDGGKTWSAPIILSNDIAGKHNFQRIWVVNNAVYVTWQINAGPKSTDWNILFRASTDDGNMWGPVQTLSPYPINPSTCNTVVICGQPTVSGFGTDVYVSWTEQSSTNDIQTSLFVASASYGASGSWTAVQNLGNGGGSHEQEIAAYGPNVYVVYDGAQDYIQVSHNYGVVGSWIGGATPMGKTLFTNIAGRGRELHVSAYGSNVYVVWEDNENLNNPTQTTKYQTFIMVSHDNGDTFPSTPTVLSTGLKGGSWLPLVFAGGSGTSYVYATWGQTSGGKWQTYFVTSSDEGNTWSSPLLLSSSTACGCVNAFHPQIYANGSRVDVMYFGQYSGSSNRHAFLTESTNGGANFGTTSDLSNNVGITVEVQNDQPQITFASDGSTVATWLESSQVMVSYST
ncbi:MAG: sialidase family protein [Nitrososphaerales archaeon]